MTHFIYGLVAYVVCLWACKVFDKNQKQRVENIVEKLKLIFNVANPHAIKTLRSIVSVLNQFPMYVLCYIFLPPLALLMAAYYVVPLFRKQKTTNTI